jgi:hypothetical protein
MTDATIRPISVTLTALAVLAVILDVPAAIRIPTVLVFALVAPGLALSRFMPDTGTVDRLAISCAASASLTIVASLALVATERWSGEPVLAAVAITTMVAALAPRSVSLRRRHRRAQHEHNRELLERRHRQGEAYALLRSPNAERRRSGLLALSFLLDDEGRADEAATLRDLARAPVPVVLTIGDDASIINEAGVRDAYEHARSSDPETHREGLIQLAGVLEGTGRHDEAALLLGLATAPDLPPDPPHRA